MKIAAVVLAAGSGVRFGADKLLIELGGRPIWRWSYEAFKNHPMIGEVIVVTSENKILALKQTLGESAEVILGGDTRLASSIAGLWKAAQIGCDAVLFHDAARPFVSEEIITAVATAVQAGKAVAPAISVADTIKRVEVATIVDHLDRSSLVAMQTPQGAPIQMFVDSLPRDPSVQLTDEMAWLASAGLITEVVAGDEANFKITNSLDLAKARAMLGESSETRTGLGYDIHQFSKDPKRKMWLGGVFFPDQIGLEGHSDADVILHAVVDALLGAIAGGDIGQLFPNDDPTNKDRNSAEFLTEAVKRVTAQGWRINLIDIAVQAEFPKIMPQAEAIRIAISTSVCDAGQTAFGRSQVSVKATTQEKLGAIGRGEGICAFAVATLSR